MTHFPHLFSPLRIGAMQVRNRILSTGHDTVMAQDGQVTDRLIAYQEARAKGVAGLIVTQVSGVHESAPLRHAIAGTLATLAEGVALCAPGPNSYRRFRAEAYVPMHANWSVNNRGSALRVPESDPDNLRLEHRLGGADGRPLGG